MVNKRLAAVLVQYLAGGGVAGREGEEGEGEKRRGGVGRGVSYIYG